MDANLEVQQKKQHWSEAKALSLVFGYFLLPIFNEQFKFCILTISNLKRTSAIDLVILTCWWVIFIDTWSLLQMVLITSFKRKCHSKQFRPDGSLGAGDGIVYTLISETLLLTHLFSSRSAPLAFISFH